MQQHCLEQPRRAFWEVGLTVVCGRGEVEEEPGGVGADIAAQAWGVTADGDGFLQATQRKQHTLGGVGECGFRSQAQCDEEVARGAAARVSLQRVHDVDTSGTLDSVCAAAAVALQPHQELVQRLAHRVVAG